MNQSHLYVALGSNIGNKFAYLQKAVDALFLEIGHIEKISPVYETVSWGFKAEPFLNAVIYLKTNLKAEEILKKILTIEKKLGRIKKQTLQYESRIIDIDILYVDDLNFSIENLEIPHPKMQQRRFVLQPLNDIAPQLVHPIIKKSTTQLLNECIDKAENHKTPRWLKNPASEYNLAHFGYITIEGNIGAGKTSFAEKIANDFNAKLVLERFADNPFLPKFYKDQSRFAFSLEMSFLADRYQQVHDDLNQLNLFNDFIVADFDIYKSLIFAKITLQDEEYKLYRRLFEMMYKNIKRPELYVFLFQSTDKLLENIKHRARKYEQSITPDYLESIQKGYLEFIKSQPQNKVKTIDITEMDFVKNRKDYLEILKQIAS